MEQDIVIKLIELLGTFAFAISGIRHAAAKHFDWFGGYVCGIAVAIGGGTIRDVMLGTTPFWMTNPVYLICTAVALLTVVFFGRWMEVLKNAWFVFDTLGLALFTIAGIQKSLAFGQPFWVAIIMGCITGSAGGVIRDVLLNNEPVIFHKEIYAVACVLGGIVYWGLAALGVAIEATAIASFLTTCTIRFLAVRYHISLPTLKGDNMKLLLLLVIPAALLASCAETKYVPEDRCLLNNVRLTTVGGTYHDLNLSTIRSYVRQENNTKWFSVVKLPLKVYSLSGRDTTKWLNRTLRRMGEPPVLYDSTLARLTCNDLQQMLLNKGYLDGRVELWTQTKGKRLWANYRLIPGTPYTIGKLNYEIADTAIAESFHLADTANWGLKSGQQFSIDDLESERRRLTKLLNDNGYYRLHKEYIRYEADTLDGNRRVNLKLMLKGVQTEEGRDAPHRRYKIRQVTFESGSKQDTVINLRKKVLHECNYIREGDYYSSRDLQNTYNHFARLGAVKYTNISFRELPDTTLLDCRIQLQTNKPSTLSFQPEGTNTAGDLGAAATLTYQNRNLFRGSENLTVELRGAYEAIKGLEGYSNQDFIEYSVETSLTFPRFLLPFVSHGVRRQLNATSEVSLMYDLQNRPEFHRRLWSAAWRYRWTPRNKNCQYQVDVLDLNYVLMPWISDTFRRLYLDDVTSRNAILNYNYKDLFITKIGFGFAYNNGSIALKTNVETSGNVLDLTSSLFNTKVNDQGQHVIFNIAYAQYAKFDIDFTRSYQLAYRDRLVFHVGVGVAYPYGNSTLLPFEKRYFSGGANSLRGWTVRSIGPGTFKGHDGRIDFINQTGDMKLDMNVEYRTHLFWKLDGALFVDAGNIWTLRDYADQPGGQFSLRNLPSQLAANYGIGFRFNFDYFIVRFDLGMKAVNPAYKSEGETHYPLLKPRLSRDFAFHFAVGMPF